MQDFTLNHLDPETLQPEPGQLQVASLHSQLSETQQARHSLAVQLASLQAQLRQPHRSSEGSEDSTTPTSRIQAVPGPRQAAQSSKPATLGSQATPGKAGDPVLQQLHSAAALKQVRDRLLMAMLRGVWAVPTRSWKA